MVGLSEITLRQSRTHPPGTEYTFQRVPKRPGWRKVVKKHVENVGGKLGCGINFLIRFLCRKAFLVLI